MALSVLNNIASLTAQNNLAVTNNNLNNTLLQLSSGSRINSGADDPAGLSIVNGLQANITALTQSAQNATDGVGQLQVADGALSQVTTLLNRAVTLATEAANGGLTTDQYGAITNEYGSILNEINRIGNATNFNGTAVFSAQNAANPNQFVTTAPTNLTAKTALTAGDMTTVQLGNATPFTYTPGQNATTLVSGNNNLTLGSTIATGEQITLSNTAGSNTYTANSLLFTGSITGLSSASTLSGTGATNQDVLQFYRNNVLTSISVGYDAGGVSTISEAINSINTQSQTGKYGITASLGANSALVIQLATGAVTGISGNTAFVSDFGSFVGTSPTDTLGDIINQINANAGGADVTASLNANDQLQLTSTNGNLTATTNTMTPLLGALNGTNTVQDLINAINSSGLGVTAGMVNETNPNEWVSAATVTSAATTVAGSFTITSGQETNGAYANSFTYTPSTLAIDPVTGTANNETVQGVIDDINASGTPFHAYLNSASSLVITDSSYGGNLNVSTGLTIGSGSTAAGFAASGAISQLEITDPLNRGDLSVTNNDGVLGYVGVNSSGNALEGANTDSFLAASETTGESGANVFISDGEVSSNYNTIKVAVGALSSSQIGNNTTTLNSANLSNPTGASAALSSINTAISDVAAMRGIIGAGINRLNSATNVINTQVQNLTSAQSSIQDANIGQVVANLSKYQILEQTGISALAQANQNQQAVLKLLG
jgi:flagellin